MPRRMAKQSELITGFNLQLPGGLTIQTVDPTSNVKRQIVGDDVISLQV
jgi:hypothetical protein